MSDELPEKVREAIEKGPICVAIGEQALGVETYAMFARRIARLAIEESTRPLREKLQNAEEGYARRHKDATDLWEKINFPGGLNAQILELRERLERAQEVHAYERHRMQHMIEAMTQRLTFIGSLCQPDAIVLPDGRRLAYVPPPKLLRETWEALSLAIREAKE